MGHLSHLNFHTSMSTGGALACTLLGIDMLSKASASPISGLSSANTPLKDVAPTIRELSRTESDPSKKPLSVSNSTSIEPNYTQKQLECAENLGVDPSECTKKGRLIRKNKNVTQNHSIQKRNHNLSPQEACATTLNVPLEDCNQHGVFIARTQAIISSIASYLGSDDINNWTPQNISRIRQVVVLGQDLDSVQEYDFLGLSGLFRLFILENNIKTIPASIGNLTALRTLSLKDNQIETLPKEIKNLENLVSLYLDKNNLEAIPNELTELVSLTELDLSYNNIKTLPSEFGDLMNLEILHLEKNNLTSLPPSMGTIERLYQVYIYNNPLVISLELFENFLRQESHPPNIFIKYQQNPDPLYPLVDLNGTTVSLGDVIPPFYEGQTLVMNPRNTTFRNLLEKNLTPSQELFLCTYLRIQLYLENTDTALEQLYRCRDLVIPTVSTPTSISTSNNSNETITINLKKDANHDTTIGIGASFSLLTLLLMIGTGSALGVLLKNYCAQKKLSDIIAKKSFDPESLIQHIHKGTLPGTIVARLKKSEDTNLFHKLAIDEYSLLEKWVEEGKLNVARDLGNAHENFLDNDGNSVLHILAKHHPHIIDKWVRTGKISREKLFQIKNNHEQSVYFEIEQNASDISRFHTTRSETITVETHPSLDRQKSEEHLSEVPQEETQELSRPCSISDSPIKSEHDLTKTPATSTTPPEKTPQHHSHESEESFSESLEKELNRISKSYSVLESSTQLDS